MRRVVERFQWGVAGTEVGSGSGRVVRTIQNYVEGGVLDGDTNVTTEVTYTPDGNVATLTAKNPATGW